MLMGHGCAVTIIDKKPAQIEFSSQFDVKVYYGDGTRVDLLRRAGAEKAQIIAFCIDGDGLDAQALGPVLEAFPPAAVFVRAYDRRHLLRLGSDSEEHTSELQSLMRISYAFFCLENKHEERQNT